jgi:cellulose synthase/poly-beta-1,6-N-acetylglucosamine synthase-like glycosyltransferase
VTVLAIAALVLAAVPALLFLANLRHYRPAPPPCGSRKVSILIPARNEEQSIGAAVEAALVSCGVELEIIVLDDHSEDGTADIVRSIGARDSRVRIEQAPPLPEGWCGKQHACHILAQQACHELLLFLDADVRLQPDGAARTISFLEASGADLVSGVPHQETGTFLEKLVIPLIHFVLLGFLPLARMRASTHPAYAAGCGQLFLARRSAYEKAGGHAAIRTSLHDGITLPRAFRRAGLKTDLFDATLAATCRMYRRAGEVWRGLAKNATEGMANPRAIVPFTIFLIGGAVLPFVLLPIAWLDEDPGLIGLASSAAFLACLPRLMGAIRFRQSRVGALLHPLGVLLLVAIQWYALARTLVGWPAAWKGRAYRMAAAAEEQAQTGG